MFFINMNDVLLNHGELVLAINKWAANPNIIKAHRGENDERTDSEIYMNIRSGKLCEFGLLMYFNICGPNQSILNLLPGHDEGIDIRYTDDALIDVKSREVERKGQKSYWNIQNIYNPEVDVFFMEYVLSEQRLYLHFICPSLDLINTGKKIITTPELETVEQKELFRKYNLPYYE